MHEWHQRRWKNSLGFIHHDTDLLLATTIVENGIDVPNANTIIINDAHRFGLSDLHQLRGRVGRGNRKAYCLLLTPPIEDLTPKCQKTIAEYHLLLGVGKRYEYCDAGWIYGVQVIS